MIRGMAWLGIAGRIGAVGQFLHRERMELPQGLIEVPSRHLAIEGQLAIEIGLGERVERLIDDCVVDQFHGHEALLNFGTIEAGVGGADERDELVQFATVGRHHHSARWTGRYTASDPTSYRTSRD